MHRYIQTFSVLADKSNFQTIGNQIVKKNPDDQGRYITSFMFNINTHYMN